MSTLLSGQTPLQNASPWSVGSFRVDDKPVIIKAFGLGVDDLVCVRMVLNVQVGSADISSDKCKATMGKLETKASSEYLRDCGVKVCICAKQPWTVVSLSGDYELEVSGTNIQNGSVTVTADTYIGSSLPNCAAQCAVCEPVVAPLAPVTATFTPCPATFPMKWDFDQQVYPSLAVWKTAIGAFMGVTVGYTAPCTFTAPAGSVFPALVLSTPPAPPLPNTQVLSPCPVFPAQWSGSVYTSATAFAAGVAAYGTGWSYNISTCTITAPLGATFPTAPSAAPVSPITGVACPLTFPTIYQNINCANALALDQAIEQVLGVSVTVSSTAPCQVVQTSGAVGAMPANIVLSSPPLPATATLSPCPVTWPMVWSLDNQTYTSIATFKTALDAFLGITTIYTAPCGFSAPNGTVFPSMVLTAVPVVPPACLTFANPSVDITDTNGDKIGSRVNLNLTCATPANIFDIRNTSGGLITYASATIQTIDGITFNFPWNDTTGALIGYLAYQ